VAPAHAAAAAVVVAAGSGTRLGLPAKALLPLAGRPALAWSLDALEAAAEIASVVVVAGEHTRDAIAEMLASGEWPKAGAVVRGGARRQDSVLAGLRATDPAADVVAVHDAARPLATAALFNAVVRAAREHGAAVAAAPVSDTLKRVAEGRVLATVERAGLWAAQTPQAARRGLLLDGFARLGDGDVTDEASLCEAMGVPVAIVPAGADNLKITHPADVAVADALLRARLVVGGDGAAEAAPAAAAGRVSELTEGSVVPNPPRLPRTGIGYDVHRFAPGRRLVLGGVAIPHDAGLDGHSDADVLLHAVCDALLGAAGLGDIGQHFPPSDPRFAGADSRDLLRKSARLVRAAGYAPVNVDATLIAEAPRIGPHVPAMRAAIAGCLGIDPGAVGVKATTNEGMGFVGRGEGIAALAVATVVPV
jgi:2-C-methyl-D-erythritol 4-phosphate cytidylyltransferase/2-C-methyl-D-erythritol 2,4-cyclodiphosphate synthase